MSAPILCLDFDGVLHSYTSGWKGADNIPDPPVPGAMKFLWEANKYFEIAIFSSRSNQPGGINAMQTWLVKHMGDWFKENLYDIKGLTFVEELSFPNHKPPAMITIDDRAIQFTGEWPAPKQLLEFKPWNKK